MNRKTIKLLKLVSLVMILFLSVLSPLHITGVYADDEPPVQDPDALDETVKARVVFTNAPTHQPDLYVSKTVEKQNPSLTAPDVSFYFQITVDGALYANKEYELLDASGLPVTDATGVPVKGKTTAQGTFSLKDKQTARFEYVGSNKSYTVKEIGQIEDFECISPASKEVSGVIPKDGEQVNFRNLYSHDDPTPESGSLKIRKNISWPEGYKYEEEEATEFTFTVYVNGKPLKNANYNLHNIKTLRDILNYGRTDDNGQFKMEADCIATFTDLEANADYKVEELNEGKWHLVSSSYTEGSTSDNSTAVFNNTASSFAVKKTLSKGTTDKQFTFTLFGAGKTVMPDAEYWLYKNDGSRIIEDDEYVTGKTDENGQFKLSQNQTAVFVGLAAGTVYSVQEEPEQGFKQVFPASSLGYENKTVSASGNEVLSFINEPKEEKASLSVTKKLSYSEDAPLSATAFKFRLEMYDSEKEIYVPVEKAVYTIGSDTENKETDTAGEFTLRQNETATFDRLIINKYYRIKEVITDDTYPGYKLNTDDEKLKQDLTDNLYYKEDKLDDDSSLSFEFENIYTSKKTALDITKLNEDGSDVLKDAEFGLYTDEACKALLKSEITDEDGVIHFENLKAGTYYLKEITPPKGYKALPSPVKVLIERVVNADKVEGFKMSLEYDDSIMGKVEAGTTESYTKEPLLSFTVKDEDARIVVLPQTGGPGIYMYLMAGAALITYGLLEKKR